MVKRNWLSFNNMNKPKDVDNCIDIKSLEFKGIIKAILKEVLLEFQQMIAEQKQERFLTAEEVRQMLGISKATLWRRKGDGTLIPIKIGGRVMYKQSDIDKLVEKGGCYGKA